MTDEPDSAQLVMSTTSLPPDRISLFSNLDDEESWLVSVDDKSGDLSDWLDGAMKDFDKSALKKQKRLIQQQKNTDDQIVEENEPGIEDEKDIFYDAPTDFEDENIVKQTIVESTQTPREVKVPARSSNPPSNPVDQTPKNKQEVGNGKKHRDYKDFKRKVEEQEQEMYELLMSMVSRPQSSASDAGVANTSARSASSAAHPSPSSSHDTSSCSLPANIQEPAPAIKPVKGSKIPIPQRFVPKIVSSFTSRKSASGNFANGSHLPQKTQLRPSSSGFDSHVRLNPDH